MYGDKGYINVRVFYKKKIENGIRTMSKRIRAFSEVFNLISSLELRK